MSGVPEAIEEVVATVQRLQHTFEDLGVGGLQFLVQPGGNNIPIRGPFSASHEIRAPLSNW